MDQSIVTELGIVSMATQLFSCYSHAVQLELEVIVFTGSIETLLG